MTAGPPVGPGPDRFARLSRGQWAATLDGRPWTPSPAPPVDLVPEDELTEIYRPLAALLVERASAGGRPGPFVVGVTGSVAVGKSTVAAVLGRLLEDEFPGKVEAVTTDSFLLPNAELEARGILARKGFPESYDRGLQLRTLSALRDGVPGVTVPVYSHQVYDILPDRRQVVDRPDVVVVEGINVLQPAFDLDDRDGGRSPAGDVSLYVDAAEEDVAVWFRARVERLCREAPPDGDGFFSHLAALPPDQLAALIAATWTGVNLVNLRTHIAPTRARADLVLRAGPDHRVEEVLVRAGGPVAGQPGT